MAITVGAPVDSLTRAEFVLPSQKDEANPATFELQPLSGVRAMEAMSYLEILPNGDAIIRGEGLGLIIRYGLKGWKNVLDENGEDLPFNPVNVDCLGAVYLNAIANHLVSISNFGGREKKT